MFLEYIESKGWLSGSFYDDTASGTPPNESVDNETGGFTGTASQGQLTMNFSNKPSTIFGTLAGGTMTLEEPQSDGSLTEVTLIRATPSKYDKMLNWLESSVNQANAIATQEEQQAQALQQQQQQIDQDAATVSSDESALQDDESALQSDLNSPSSDLAATQSDLKQEKSDYTTEQSDLKTSPSNACGDADNVGGDDQNALGDQENLQADLNDNGSDRSTLQGAIKTLSGDWSTYESAQQGLPSYTPQGGAQTRSAEAEAIGAGNQAVSAYQAAVAEDTQTENGYVSKLAFWQRKRIIFAATGSLGCLTRRISEAYHSAAQPRCSPRL